VPEASVSGDVVPDDSSSRDPADPESADAKSEAESAAGSAAGSADHPTVDETSVGDPAVGDSPRGDPRALTDAELAHCVAAARGGSGSAVDAEAELYRRFAPRVLLYGLRHLRDRGAAEDLAQHVLLVVLEKLRAGSVREPERIGSFVLGTARLAARERQRERSRFTAAPDDVERTLGAQSPPSLRRLDAGALRDCLHALPDRERAVLLSSYYAERSAAQVAGELGLSAGNVRVIRHRAIRELRACMGLDGAAT
jgi:RNA polymerase sigma-70 factor (ECF subfamily)